MEKVGIFLGFIIIVIIALSTWSCKRHINYRFSYEDQVKQTMKPLEERIKKVEEELRKLKDK